MKNHPLWNHSQSEKTLDKLAAQTEKKERGETKLKMKSFKGRFHRNCIRFQNSSVVRVRITPALVEAEKWSQFLTIAEKHFSYILDNG